MTRTSGTEGRGTAEGEARRVRRLAVGAGAVVARKRRRGVIGDRNNLARLVVTECVRIPTGDGDRAVGGFLDVQEHADVGALRGTGEQSLHLHAVEVVLLAERRNADVARTEEPIERTRAVEPRTFHPAPRTSHHADTCNAKTLACQA